MPKDDPSTYTRRGIAAGILGVAVGTPLAIDHTLRDFELAAEPDVPSTAILEAGVTEYGQFGLTSSFPIHKLHVTAWIDVQTATAHPGGFVETIGPSGDRVGRQLLGEPTPTEVLREDYFYRVRTAERPGTHVFRVADADGGVVDAVELRVTER